MGIERYLCVGGIEVANPCRTLAYLRSLGSPCLVRPPSKRDCGCCPEWENEPCFGEIGAGYTITEQGVCGGLTALGPDSIWNLTVRGYLFAECPSSDRPPLPPDDDPGWSTISLVPGIPATALVSPSGDADCQSWADWAAGIEWFDGEVYPDACAYQCLDLVGLETGAMYRVLLYVDPSAFDQGTLSIGPAVASVDGGETWAPIAEATPVIACPGTGLLSLTTLNLPTDEGHCSGLFALTGVGPFHLVIDAASIAAAPAAPADLPPLDDPIWEHQADLSFPFGGFPGLGGCSPYDELPAVGIVSHVLLEDLGSGQRLEFYGWLDYPHTAPGSLGGSIYSLDGGVSWAPLPIGTTVLSTGEAPISGEFVSPAADDAPWFDPTVPQSADVLGVFIEEAKLSVPWERQARKALRGASLGPASLGERELTITGWLYARTEAATAYGRQWLFEALAGSGCEGGCELPDAEIYTHCNRGDAPAQSGHRTLKRVGLKAFDPEIEPEYPRSCGFKFEATLSAEIPELFLAPTLEASFPLSVGDVVCNLCEQAPEPASSACACGALAQPPRVVPQADGISAFCEPVEIRRGSAMLAAPSYWREATAILSVDPGGEPLSNLRIRGYANPAGLPEPSDAGNPFATLEACLDVEIGCVPAGAILTIDGTTRTATLLCDGIERNGYAQLSSSSGKRFSWPDVGCSGLMLIVDADAYNTGPEATLSLQVIPRERG